ncbi:transcriptional activator RhaR [Escherichia coli]|uniref:HTH-type transcriptional activator RhaR n=3 Tax=Gammaproteobacteria TaxID=1236 RepID=A0A377B607_ECOLX|nr:transcriptional activator RhaR [Escherichia coli]
MVFCNNANLLNVFVRHIANNQLRSLAEVATVAHQLKLLKDDFFASDQQAVAVADRYPQDVFAEHTHDFCELVIVWRGNGLHVLNDRPYRITRGDLFYIHADDKHSYASVNDLVLQNIIYCPERLKLNLDWQGAIPGFSASAGQPHWRLGSVGMAQARQVIGQLEHESSQHVSFANEMAELLFGQLVMLLNRHRYTSDSLPPTSSETLLDKLITRLAASLKSPFALDKFCDEASCSERVLRQQFRQQTGMTINQYLRQVRVCHAQYLLQHSRLLISDISTECGFEDSNYFSVVFTPGNRDDAQPVASSQFAERLIRHADADDVSGDNNHHTTEAQHRYRTASCIVPLFQHQPDDTAAQYIEAHMQHPTDVVILRRNAGVAPGIEKELQIPHQPAQCRE